MTTVVRFHELGGPDVLRLENLEVPTPGSSEVKIRVEAIGLNRADLAFRAGRYLERPKLPSRLGYEGTVHARAGYAVHRRRPGHRALHRNRALKIAATEIALSGEVHE